MLFGSISYLNLLPFQLFLKQRLSTQTKQALHYRRDVPSQINHAFHRRRVNAAFISSVTSASNKCTDLGIVADGAVRSVFVIEGNEAIDRDSATSNILAQILGLKGEVLIGDKALRNYLATGEGVDLAQRWKEETNLPFVFARLCYNAHGTTIESLAKCFASQKVRIPQTTLKREAKRKGITPKELRWYLEHIHYSLNHRAKRSLKLFLKKAKKF